MRKYCPKCRRSTYGLYAGGSWICSECGSNITAFLKAEASALVREIHAAIKDGKLVTAVRHFPVRPSVRAAIDKARGGVGGVQVRWLGSHKWQHVTRDQISGIE